MNKKKRFANIVLVVLVVVLIGAAGYLVFSNSSGTNSLTTVLRPNPSPSSTSQSGIVKIKLLDAYSGQAISNADVRIYSDNGIRCITAPCDAEGQEWTGVSDSGGVVFVPSDVINVATTVTAEGYTSGRDLNRDSENKDNDDWLLELDPNSKIDNFERRLKLIDSQTQKPVSNTALWITNSQNCRPPQCSDYVFTGTTNNLGNIYYPTSSVKSNSWVSVDNYKVVELPTGWVNFKVILDRE